MSKITKNRCAVCFKCVRDNQRAIFCDSCNHWVHLKCTNLSCQDYITMSDSTDSWYCQQCVQGIFPFNHFDDDDDFLNCIFIQALCNNPNPMFQQTTAQLKVMNKYTVVDRDIDPDQNLPCYSDKNISYYTDYEFNEFISKTKTEYCNNFSVIHINARIV
jgi:hypothetical protein